MGNGYDGHDGRRHLGLIAQDVDPLIPEVVERGKNLEDPLGMNYSEFVPVLIKAIQEQQATITSLTSRVAALEQLVQQLKKQHD